MHALRCRNHFAYLVIFLLSRCDCSVIEISDDLAKDLYSSYKDAVLNEKDTVSFRRILKNDKKFEIHVKKLRAVNGYKKHNLMIKEDHPKNPLIYIDNPVETKIPTAYLTYQEFKKELEARVLHLRKEFVKPEHLTTKPKKAKAKKKLIQVIPVKVNHNSKERHKSGIIKLKINIPHEGHVKIITNEPVADNIHNFGEKVQDIVQETVTENITDVTTVHHIVIAIGKNKQNDSNISQSRTISNKLSTKASTKTVKNETAITAVEEASKYTESVTESEIDKLNEDKHINNETDMLTKIDEIVNSTESSVTIETTSNSVFAATEDVIVHESSEFNDTSTNLPTDGNLLKNDGANSDTKEPKIVKDTEVSIENAETTAVTESPPTSTTEEATSPIETTIKSTTTTKETIPTPTMTKLSRPLVFMGGDEITQYP